MLIFKTQRKDFIFESFLVIEKVHHRDELCGEIKLLVGGAVWS